MAFFTWSCGVVRAMISILFARWAMVVHILRPLMT